MRAGRKRNSNAVRDASGKSRGERPELVRAVALAYRARAVGVVDAADPLAGSTLGRLFLRHQRSGLEDPGAINERQFNAGLKYATLLHSFASVMGLPKGDPRSQGFELVASGLSCARPPDDRTVLRLRRQWSDCYRVLMDASRQFALGPQGVRSKERQRIATLTYDACLDRIPAERLSAEDIGLLRIGLNELGRVLG